MKNIFASGVITDISLYPTVEIVITVMYSASRKEACNNRLYPMTPIARIAKKAIRIYIIFRLFFINTSKERSIMLGNSQTN
ncbi:MAG: hypothetical protein GXY43_04855 [Clostridiaceae bacterium]|nr:hypothetical protein [Clostridiaceae bacterium]